MANVNWIKDEIYVVILNDCEKSQLQHRANKDAASSTFLGRIITVGLALAERIEDKGGEELVKDE